MHLLTCIWTRQCYLHWCLGAGNKAQTMYLATDNLFEVEDKAKARGYSQLGDLEVLTTQRPYSESSWSVWEKDASSSLWTGGYWADMTKDFNTYKKARGRSRRDISDIEPYYSVANNGIYFQAIFKSGSRKQHLIRSFSWDGFVKHWKMFNNKMMSYLNT